MTRHASPALMWLLAAAVFSVQFIGQVAPALGQDSDRYVDEAGRGLRRGGFPWYDESEEDLRAIERPTQPQRREWNGPSFGFGPIFSQIIQVAFVIILIAIICGLVYLLVRAFLKQERVSEASGELVKVVNDEARIEALPFNVREPTRDFLEHARMLYQKGEFNEAIVYLYSHMLLHLDKNQLIRLNKGKTNRQYLVEMKERPVLADTLERTMVSFEDVFFGSHSLQREDFEGCWNQLDRFHEKVTEATT